MKFFENFTHESSRQPYEYFNERQDRQNIYRFCMKLTEYLHDKDISNIIFLDRSARAAWIGVYEYWKNVYKGEEKPGIYFVNPDGFNPDAEIDPRIKLENALTEFMKRLSIPILPQQRIIL